jgi:hypothetical protein
VHPVVRASVYAELTGAERGTQACGGRGAARRGERSDRADRRAPAADAAGDGRAGISTLRQAADRALAKGDPDAAASYLRRAADEPLEDAERADLLYRLGLAERLVDSPLAARHLREAHALTTDPIDKARVALDLGRTPPLQPPGRGGRPGARGRDHGRRRERPRLCRRLEAGLLTVTHDLPPALPARPCADGAR